MKVKDIVTDIGIKIYRINYHAKEIYCWCPFHDDKSPSFNINYISGKWHCWAASCSVAGQSINDLVFRLTGHKEHFIEDDKEWLKGFREKLRQTHSGINRSAYIPVLKLALNNPGQEFLNKRGIDNDSITRFGLMYWDTVNAVVIPVNDVGYNIRYIDAVLTKDKYKYVAGTKITNCLFGTNNLNFNNHKSIILTEGCFDAIHLQSYGYPAVALMHSDISDIQRHILMEYQLPVYIMMDGDDPGKEAAIKIKKRLRGDFLVRVCNTPDGKDPDSLTKEEIEIILKEAK
jgi:DNA primase